MGAVVFVAATSPLTVKETSASTPVPARLVSGSSYTPVVGDAVLVLFAHGVYYVLGGA
jgi:hypothetical protein